MNTSTSTDRSPRDSLFRLSERQTTVRREIGAGVTTFMVMAYIIFVNPTILSFVGVSNWEGKGPPFPQVVVATCFASALMTLLMGLVSNRPFALAPGMGLNAVVAYQLVIGMGLTWQEAMGVVLVEGVAVTLLVLVGLREAVMHAVPASLKHSIAVGIGCFIFFIGLINGGLVRVPVESIAVVGGAATGQPATPLALGALGTVSVCVTLFGLAITVLLFARGWQSALLLGMILTTVLATAVNSLTGGTSLAAGAKLPESLWAMPDLGFLALPGVQGTAGMFAKLGLLSGLLVVFSLMLTDFFDTMGTIIGVSHQTGRRRADGAGRAAPAHAAGRFPGGRRRRGGGRVVRDHVRRKCGRGCRRRAHGFDLGRDRRLVRGWRCSSRPWRASSRRKPRRRR